VRSIGLDRIAEYERQLLLYAERLLKEIPGLRLIGTALEKWIRVKQGRHCRTLRPPLRATDPETVRRRKQRTSVARAL
jgi:selenocysteine lyase/cysteine desulfurase